MAGINVNDVVHFTVRGSIAGQMTMSTFYYKCTAASTSLSYPTAIAAAASGFNTSVLSPGQAFSQASPQNWMWDKTRAQRVYPTRGIFVDANVANPGQMPSNAEAANICASITRKSIQAGRRYVGVLHTTPLAASAYTGSLLTNAYKTLANALASAMKNRWTVLLETTELQPILWTESVPNDLTKTVEVTTLQDQVRTMRRRTVGVGI